MKTIMLTKKRYTVTEVELIIRDIYDKETMHDVNVVYDFKRHTQRLAQSKRESMVIDRFWNKKR